MLKLSYRVLELEPGATATAVKRAYRRLARRYHPDKSLNSACVNSGGAGNVGKFNEVCQAYRSVIVDAQQRSQLAVIERKSVGAGTGDGVLSLYDAAVAYNCRRRRRGSPSDRRFGWQLPEEYLGTQVAFKV